MDKTEALTAMGTETDTARLITAYVTGAATWEETLAGLRDVMPEYRTGKKRPPIPDVNTPEFGEWWQDVEDGPEEYDPTVHSNEGDLGMARTCGLITPDEWMAALVALREGTPVAETAQ